MENLIEKTSTETFLRLKEYSINFEAMKLLNHALMLSTTAFYLKERILTDEEFEEMKEEFEEMKELVNSNVLYSHPVQKRYTNLISKSGGWVGSDSISLQLHDYLRTKCVMQKPGCKLSFGKCDKYKLEDILVAFCELGKELVTKDLPTYMRDAYNKLIERNPIF